MKKRFTAFHSHITWYKAQTHGPWKSFHPTLSAPLCPRTACARRNVPSQACPPGCEGDLPNQKNLSCIDSPSILGKQGPSMRLSPSQVAQDHLQPESVGPAGAPWVHASCPRPHKGHRLPGHSWHLRPIWPGLTMWRHTPSKWGKIYEPNYRYDYSDQMGI